MAPKTVYLHVGLHKTGTTYLQNVFRANRKQLRDEHSSWDQIVAGMTAALRATPESL